MAFFTALAQVLFPAARRAYSRRVARARLSAACTPVLAPVRVACPQTAHSLDYYGT